LQNSTASLQEVGASPEVFDDGEAAEDKVLHPGPVCVHAVVLACPWILRLIMLVAFDANKQNSHSSWIHLLIRGLKMMDIIILALKILQANENYTLVEGQKCKGSSWKEGEGKEHMHPARGGRRDKSMFHDPS
ncbi:hypothetical protein J5N97_003958, partial [Dioscorea zingiberensis]